MRLAKSCNTKYHIKNGTLKLGTLHEYRLTEDKQIADAEEGVRRFNIYFKGPVKIPNVWLNTLFGGTFGFGNGEIHRFPGPVRSKVISLRQNYTTDVFTELGDSLAIVTRETHNCFIFCMSDVPTREEAIGIFPTYDDCWFISKEQIETFGMEVSHLLREAIASGREAGNHIIPEKIDIERLIIGVEYGNVSYDSRDIGIGNNNLFCLDQLHKLLQDIEFTKPPTPFQKEKEFRFKFLLISNDQIVPPLVNSIVLSSDRLLKFVE